VRRRGERQRRNKKENEEMGLDSRKRKENGVKEIG